MPRCKRIPTRWGQALGGGPLRHARRPGGRDQPPLRRLPAGRIADTGKPRSLASHIDIPRGAANFKIFTDTIKNVPTESFEMRTPDGGPPSATACARRAA
jgi:hypothetical protein